MKQFLFVCLCGFYCIGYEANKKMRPVWPKWSLFQWVNNVGQGWLHRSFAWGYFLLSCMHQHSRTTTTHHMHKTKPREVKGSPQVCSADGLPVPPLQGCVPPGPGLDSRCVGAARLSGCRHVGMQCWPGHWAVSGWALGQGTCYHQVAAPSTRLLLKTKMTLSVTSIHEERHIVDFVWLSFCFVSHSLSFFSYLSVAFFPLYFSYLNAQCAVLRDFNFCWR